LKSLDLSKIFGEFMAFRVMTYNILDGGMGREDSILEVIQAVDPDLIVIQEIIESKTLKFLAQTLQMQAFIGTGNTKRKVALLSRLPVLDFKNHHPIFPIWNNVLEAEIQHQPEKTFRLIGVHLVAGPWIGFELWRRLEINYIVKRYQQFSQGPFLIAGDFNGVARNDNVIIDRIPGRLRRVLWLQGNRFFHYSLQSLLSSGFTDCFRSINPDNAGFTLPPPQPNIRLDYIFINNEMKKHLKKCWVVCEPSTVVKASDHYPVVAEFNIEE
jgi:exonuclease III